MNRRQMITAGPLAGLAAALVAGDVNAAVIEALSVGERETRVMRLYREWEQARKDEAATYEAFPDDDSPEPGDATAKVVAIERRLMAERAVTLADVALKFCAVSGFGEFVISDEGHPELWAEARALIG